MLVMYEQRSNMLAKNAPDGPARSGGDRRLPVCGNYLRRAPRRRLGALLAAFNPPLRKEISIRNVLAGEFPAIGAASRGCAD